MFLLLCFEEPAGALADAGPCALPCFEEPAGALAGVAPWALLCFEEPAGVLADAGPWALPCFEEPAGALAGVGLWALPCVGVFVGPCFGDGRVVELARPSPIANALLSRRLSGNSVALSNGVLRMYCFVQGHSANVLLCDGRGCTYACA